MNLLIISRDVNFLEPAGSMAGDVVARHELYLERLRLLHPGSNIRILVLARYEVGGIPWRNNGILTVASVGLRNAWRAVFRLLHVVIAPRSTLFTDWRPDIVTSQSPVEDGLFALLLAGRFAVSYAAQIHFLLSQLHTDFSCLTGFVKRRICDVVLVRAKIIRFVSASQRKEFEGRYKLARTYCYTVPVAMMFEPVECESHTTDMPPLVLYAGRFVEHKNLHCWVAVAAEVARHNPETRFRMIGDGPLKSEIMHLAAQEGLADHITFPNTMTTKELTEEYRRTSVFLLTSNQDAFGRVVAEANAYGVPVVSTRAGGPDEIIVPGETGYLEVCGDWQALSRDVIQLLDDDDLRKQMGKAAQTRVRQIYDPVSLADQIVAGWASALQLAPT